MSQEDFDEPTPGLDTYIRLHYNLEIRWDPRKSERLKRARGMSFDEVLRCRFIDLRENPSRRHQRLLLAERDGYIWAVPCVEDEGGLFLKTMFRCRKYTKKWLRGEFPSA